MACGVVAGPLFLAVLMIQAFTREGFDLSRHPLSLLSLGDLGWIQIANFVVTGALFIACAIGMRRVLRPGRSGTWAPRLVGAFGVGLILAGVFTTDAGAGFPPGAPAGSPEQISWHGILHEVGFGLAFLGMIVGCWCSRDVSWPSSAGVGSEPASRRRRRSSCCRRGPTPTASVCDS